MEVCVDENAIETVNYPSAVVDVESESSAAEYIRITDTEDNAELVFLEGMTSSAWLIRSESADLGDPSVEYFTWFTEVQDGYPDFDGYPN